MQAKGACLPQHNKIQIKKSYPQNFKGFLCSHLLPTPQTNHGTDTRHHRLLLYWMGITSKVLVITFLSSLCLQVILYSASICGAGNWTQGLACTSQVLYCWATPQPLFLFKTFFFLNFTCMGAFPKCMCVHYMCAVPTEDRRGHEPYHLLLSNTRKTPPTPTLRQRFSVEPWLSRNSLCRPG